MRGGVGILTGVVALVTVAGIATASGGTLVVSAGLDQDVVMGDTVYLDAGGTHVVDGELSGLEWSIETPDGRTITPDCVDCELTHFRPNQTGPYDVTLTARSASETERSDTLYVTVAERPGSVPTVEIGNESNGTTGDTGDNNGCFISHHGDAGEAMSYNICNLVGADEPGVVEAVADERGIVAYTIPADTLVDDYAGAEFIGDGKFRVPSQSVHHQSVELYREYRESQRGRNIPGNTSGNSAGNGRGPSDETKDKIGDSGSTDLDTCNNLPPSVCS